MVSATLAQEFEMTYDVSFRELPAPHPGREVSARERFYARARYSRSEKRNSPVDGAYRRRVKRSYMSSSMT